MTNVKYIVDNLDPDVEVVTLEELMIHLRNNYGTLAASPASQNVVVNGSFETPAPGNPSRPASWFYAAAAGATQIVNGQDSTGAGTKAAAINQVNADWRSAQFAVQPGEQLTFSFDFMFNGVPSGSGFRADARFFTSSSSFVGETVQFLNAANYAAGVWHNFTTTAVVPAGATIGDVRFSTFFGAFAGGQVLVDDVQLLRFVGLAGDYNGDQHVDSGDYVIWRNMNGQTVNIGTGADGDRNGVIDEGDYQVWRAAYGNTLGSGTLAAPEPATGILLLSLTMSATLARLATSSRTV
jgi:hypothetical protein